MCPTRSWLVLLLPLAACSQWGREYEVHQVAAGTVEAVELAEQVRERAGGLAGWRRVRNLAFTFDGQRRVFWDVEGQKVRIENLAPEPREWSVLVHDLATGRDLIGAPAGATTVSARAFWQNDTFWLLAPLKLLDPGARLALDPRDPADAPGVRRLHLRYAPGSATPDDEYVLHVDTVAGDVLQWDRWHGGAAAPRSWRFEEYATVGPLRLSLRRTPAGDGTPLEFRDLLLNASAPPAIWRAPAPILHELRPGRS
jgi:hypothetical protein